MHDYRSLSHAMATTEVYSSCREPASSSNITTAYYGAQGDINDATPTIRLDKESDFAHLTDRTTNLPTTPREALGARWLSSLSTTSPAVTAALARSGSVLHNRARSWAANVPKLNTGAGTSPDKANARQSKIFGDLFAGQSAPVQIGVPTSPVKEETEFVMEYTSKFTERPPLRQMRRESTMSAKMPARPKSSWFSRKSSQCVVPNAATASDEIINMNINNELFPHGAVDPLSPQAFNDLLLNATNLLQRMQTAYKEKVQYISNVQPEIDAQKEEVEEAETRLAMYKSQLEDIGRQHEEQKEVNKELIEQLSAEKIKLQEAREAAKATVRLVRRDTEAQERIDDEARRRRKRGSAASASDSGFESDADTASVWSAQTPISQRQSQFMLSPEYADIAIPRGSSNRPGCSRASTISQQSTTFSAIPQRCPHGEGAAWATVEQLRHENQGLRSNVEHLQHSLQDCIDLIEGSTAR